MFECLYVPVGARLLQGLSWVLGSECVLLAIRADGRMDAMVQCRTYMHAVVPLVVVGLHASLGSVPDWVCLECVVADAPASPGGSPQHNRRR